jgi:mRNA-degrading endonuclease YafQ of YafQ-DinJ toxin-antitoxin module
MPFRLTNRFEKKYLNKTVSEQDKVDETLDTLEQNPKHPGLHTHRVQGTKRIWECYMDDSLRITFEYGKRCIILRNNCKHNIVLRNP